MDALERLRIWGVREKGLSMGISGLALPRLQLAVGESISGEQGRWFGAVRRRHTGQTGPV